MAHEALITAVMLSEPYQDEKIKSLGKDAGTVPTVVRIEDIDTGEEALLVVNTLMASAFERSGLPITGKIFQFRGGDLREGKTYRQVDVTEMREEN